MKKLASTLLVALALVATSCSTGSNVLGSVLGGTSTSTSTSSSSSSSTASNVLGGLLNTVIGATTVTQSQIVGTWKYNGPGVAFTSENLLAKAGGDVAAQTAKQKLQTTYNSVGFSSSNTYVTFNEDNTFSAKFKGVPVSGTYTFDSSSHAVKFQSTLFSSTGYITRNTSGIGLMFESKKLLSLLQTLTALSGNSTLSTVGEISKSYDGIRLGFEMNK